jgi:uncharacterized protein YyaL (SSP411 family)
VALYPLPMIFASFAVLLIAAQAPVQHLSKDQRAQLHGQFLDEYDAGNGGFGAGEKRIDLASLEAAALLVRAGDHRFDEVVAKTLDGGLKLLDAKRGGIFRASRNADWTNPYKEKPAAAEAEALLAFCLGYSLHHAAHHLAAARSISSWLAKNPPTTKYDVALTIRALAALHDASGDDEPLARALKLADAIKSPRDANEVELIERGQARLALYRSTADRAWLPLGMAYLAAAQKDASFFGGPENASFARFANLLAQYTNNDDAPKLAGLWFKYATGASKPAPRGELIAADLELSSDPLHMTVVGPKQDAGARALFLAALKAPEVYSRIEWWDPAEGPLPNPDIPLPQTGRPAAYSCSNGICSLPLHDPSKLAAHF